MKNFNNFCPRFLFYYSLSTASGLRKASSLLNVIQKWHPKEDVLAKWRSGKERQNDIRPITRLWRDVRFHQSCTTSEITFTWCINWQNILFSPAEIFTDFKWERCFLAWSVCGPDQHGFASPSSPNDLDRLSVLIWASTSSLFSKY